MEKTSGYLSQSWKDLTTDPNWWKSVTIFALVSLIPIVGTMFVTGYMLDWAREGAWGMKRGLPNKVGSAGKRLKWGFFSIVISFCWILPVSIVTGILAFIPLVGILVLLCGALFMIALTAVVMAGCVNMAIYDNIKAGFQFRRLFNMAGRDTGGLARCFCMVLLAMVPSALYLFICGGEGLVDTSSLQGLGASELSILSYGLIGTGGATSLIRGVLYLAAIFFGTMLQAMSYRAFGLWVGQFQPAKWGGIDQPMPFEPGYVAPAAAAAATATTPTETPEPASDDVIEAEVVSVDDVEPAVDAATEEAAAAKEAAATSASPATHASYCANCGSPVGADNKFCPKCGYKL